jgi:hypothetical protein
VSRISEIANTMAAGQRCDMQKDSTAPRKDHPINVILLRETTQEQAMPECAAPAVRLSSGNDFRAASVPRSL